MIIARNLKVLLQENHITIPEIMDADLTVRITLSEEEIQEAHDAAEHQDLLDQAAHELRRRYSHFRFRQMFGFSMSEAISPYGTNYLLGKLVDKFRELSDHDIEDGVKWDYVFVDTVDNNYGFEPNENYYLTIQDCAEDVRDILEEMPPSVWNAYYESTESTQKAIVERFMDRCMDMDDGGNEQTLLCSICCEAI